MKGSIETRMSQFLMRTRRLVGRLAPGALIDSPDYQPALPIACRCREVKKNAIES